MITAWLEIFVEYGGFEGWIRRTKDFSLKIQGKVECCDTVNVKFIKTISLNSEDTTDQDLGCRRLLVVVSCIVVSLTRLGKKSVCNCTIVYHRNILYCMFFFSFAMQHLTMPKWRIQQHITFAFCNVFKLFLVHCTLSDKVV